MKLTSEELDMLEGKYGKAAKKSMEILTTLGEIFDAECMTEMWSISN
ncbi:hypothetical protein ES703_95005 [subsurface metagenome]